MEPETKPEEPQKPSKGSEKPKTDERVCRLCNRPAILLAIAQRRDLFSFLFVGEDVVSTI